MNTYPSHVPEEAPASFGHGDRQVAPVRARVRPPTLLRESRSERPGNVTTHVQVSSTIGRRSRARRKHVGFRGSPDSVRTD